MTPQISAFALLVVPLVWVPWLSDFDQPKWALVALLAVAGFAHWLVRGRGSLTERPLWLALWCLPGLLLAVNAAAASSLGASPVDGIRDVARLIAAITVAFVTAQLAPSPAGRRMIVAAGAGACALVLAAQILMDLGITLGVPHARGVLTSTLGNSALAGELAVASLPFVALAFTLAADRVANILLGLAATLPVATLIYLSDSRAAWLATGAFALVRATLGRRGRATVEGTPRATHAGARLIGAAALAGALALSAAACKSHDLPAPAQRLTTIAAATHATNLVRLELWRGALAIAGDHPLAGAGGGRFGDHYPLHRRAVEWTLSGLASVAEHPHDEPLRILAEYGAIGCLAAAGAVLLVCRRLWSARRGADAAGRQSAVAALAGLAALGVFALFWCPTRQPATMLAAATMLGLALGDARGAGSPVAARAPIIWIATPLVALQTFAAGATLVADGRFVALRESCETQKRRLVEDPASMSSSVAGGLGELGTTGERLADHVASKWATGEQRHRLALALADLVRTRRQLESALRPGTEGLDDDARRKLLACVQLMPGPPVLRRALAACRAASPHHLGVKLLQIALDRTDGRVPEAMRAIDETLAANPQTPLVRVELARILAAPALEGAAIDEATQSLITRGIAELRAELALYSGAAGSDAVWELLVRTVGGSGRLLEALGAVDEWTRARGDDDRRRAVGGDVALHIGETPETVGLFLESPETPAERSARGAGLAARLDGLPAAERRTALLAHLGRHPFDAPALDALAAALEEILRPLRNEAAAAVRAQRHRAIGRSKVLYAWEHHEAKRTKQFETLVRVGRRLRPELADLAFLELLRALETGNDAAALDILRRWRDGGMRDFAFLDRLPATREYARRVEARAVIQSAR
jgi:hypothetical protein